MSASIVTTPTFDFMWKNGILMQKVHVHQNGEGATWQEVTAPPGVEWRPVQVGGKPVKDPTFKTFEDRNGRAPEDSLPKNKPNDQFSRHVIEFDGGTSCNSPKKGYGEGYGSYQIDGEQIVRVTFGKGHSNNSAEIRTLVEGLKALAEIPCGKPRIVMARGDSQIALKWVKQGGKPRDATSQGFQEAVELLREQVKRFHNVKTEWRRRTHSVALFGH